jgi:hypothetical protein
MDRLLKILWFIIGILLIIILPFAGFNLIREEFFSPDYSEPYEDQSLILGDEQRKAIKEGKMIQGIIYDRIERIPGTRYRILPLSAKKFNNPKDIEKFYAEFEEARSRAGDMSMGGFYGNVNFIFLDENYNVINTLLDTKAYISQRMSPGMYERVDMIDPSIKNMLYLITFHDSNSDGLLNELDNSDLYISDIDGSNLRQITKDIHILDFDFTNNSKEVYMVFQKRDSVSNEFKRKLFAKYKIEEDTLIEFTGLHKTILELEKSLMIDTLNTL